MGLGRVGFWFGFGGQGIEVTVSDALQALVKTEIIFTAEEEWQHQFGRQDSVTSPGQGLVEL